MVELLRVAWELITDDNRQGTEWQATAKAWRERVWKLIGSTGRAGE